MNTAFLNILALCLLCSGSLRSQQYFRLLENSFKPYEQKIGRFANGDVVLAGSPIEGETAGQSGGLNLTRLDKCGNVSWAMNYQWDDKYMSLKDIAISESGDIFVYGSAYERLTEYIFLLKLNGKGTVQTFRVFHPGTVDHFTYNIEVKNNRVIAYGLLLHYNTVKRGFIAIFNDGLNFIWGKVFEPFESSGQAIMTDDNGFLCQSEDYLLKLNGQGELQWATTLQERINWRTVAGPLEVKDGYIFEFANGNHAFFYKLNKNGALIWRSQQFSTVNTAADLTLLPTGDVLALYNCPETADAEKNYPCQLLLSPDGVITQQKKLVIEQSLQTASIRIALGNNKMVTAIGSTDIRAAYLNGPAGFMLQYSLDSLNGNCFRWEPFESLAENDLPMELIPLTTTFFPLTMNNVEASIQSKKRNFTLAESCHLVTEKVISIDTFLACGQNWQVRLPHSGFKWEDENPNNVRILERPGVYRASDNNCIAPVIYEYNFQREPCQCKIYLPTAFSPNYDGQNEKLELFSNCTLSQVQFSIYDRWGGKIFSSNDINAAWDGKYNNKLAESDIYVAVIRYQLLNDSNEVEEGSLVQNVQLVR